MRWREWLSPTRSLQGGVSRSPIVPDALNDEDEHAYQAQKFVEGIAALGRTSEQVFHALETQDLQRPRKRKADLALVAGPVAPVVACGSALKARRKTLTAMRTGPVLIEPTPPAPPAPPTVVAAPVVPAPMERPAKRAAPSGLKQPTAMGKASASLAALMASPASKPATTAPQASTPKTGHFVASKASPASAHKKRLSCIPLMSSYVAPSALNVATAPFPSLTLQSNGNLLAPTTVTHGTPPSLAHLTMERLPLSQSRPLSASREVIG